MIIDVYDLTGRYPGRHRYEAEPGEDPVLAGEQSYISDVLIEPQSALCRNQPPYLQDWSHPILRDLIDENGQFEYSAASFLGSFLQNECAENASRQRQLKSFFTALQASRYVDSSNPPDYNVILVPDNYSPRYQEFILRHCALPRNKTILLWRSVAACLGCISQGTPGQTVTIIDVQQSYVDSIELTLQEEDGYIIPQRRAFKPDKDVLRHHDIDGRRRFLPTNEFYRHTYHGKVGHYVVWNGSCKGFDRLPFERAGMEKASLSKVNKLAYACMSKGLTVFVGSKLKFPTPNIVSDSKGKQMCWGAALFVSRKEAGLPTYFDECTGLFIVVQDSDNEEVLLKTLVPPSKRCRGGAEIIGETNRDFGIASGSDSISFYLSEEYGGNVKLKLLNHQFNAQHKQGKQPLILYPSMVPGQGLAQVRVEAKPLISQDIYLDLMEMSDTETTVNKLADELQRSFPVDIPCVEADSSLWCKVSHDVKKYVDGVGGLPSPNPFAKCKLKHSGASGIDALVRINVFGNAEGKEYPVAHLKFFHQLFDKLARDYELLSKDYERTGKKDKDDEANKVLAAISRTYKGNYKAFSFIKKRMLKKIYDAAYNPHLPLSVNKHHMTACAYLLHTPDELRTFFECYQKMAEKICDRWTVDQIIHCRKVPDLSGLNDWNRALADLLIFHPEMLSHVSTKTCERCMQYMAAMLLSHHYCEKKVLKKNILKAMLFMLKRRKYDHKIFLEPCSSARSDVERALEWVAAKVKHELENIVLEFLRGTGCLMDLPDMIEDE